MTTDQDAEAALLIAPAEPPEQTKPGTEDCVPLSALGMPDEQEQMQAPEVGDKVQFTIEGTVNRIEGDQAFVARESINGQPVEGRAEPDQDEKGGPPDNDRDDYGKLEGEAEKMGGF
jgi:hypothetical protein